MYMTYQELKGTDAFKNFDESFVRKNYRFLLDIHDMRYCEDGTVLLWVDKYRVDVTELYNEADKKEIMFHQRYLDDFRRERAEEQREYQEQKENDWCQTILDTSTIVKTTVTTVTTVTWELNLEDKKGFLTDCSYDGVYDAGGKFVDTLILESKDDGANEDWFVRYLNGDIKPYDDNNTYHVKLKKHIFSNLSKPK